MSEVRGFIPAVAVKFHHLQAVARCAGAAASRFSIPAVHVQVMQDRVVFEATDGSIAGVVAIPIQAEQTALDDAPSWDGKCLALPPAGFQSLIPLPKWAAIRPKGRHILPCSSTLYLSFPPHEQGQSPKVRMKCGLDGDGPVLTLDLLDESFPAISRVTRVSNYFRSPAKQMATLSADYLETLAGAFSLFHGPTAGRGLKAHRPMTVIPTAPHQAWGFYAEDCEDIPALFYVVLMSLCEEDKEAEVYDQALLPILRSMAGDLRDPRIAAEEGALSADHLAYAAMAENGRRLHMAREARNAQQLLDALVA